MDPELDDTDSPCKLMTCMQTALLCVQENANDRPTMLQVFSMLKNDNTAMENPKKPAFFFKKNPHEEPKSKTRSINDASISQLVAR